MESLNKYLLPIMVAVAFFHQASNSCAEEKRIITPENMMQIFYKYILSDSPASECPDIFYSADSFVATLPEHYKEVKENANSTIIWNYLRDIKETFLFPTIDPHSTLNKIKINYLFSNFPDNQVFFEGTLSIVLIAPLSPKGKDGVYKEIVFSLEKNPGPYQHRYLLNLHSTRVNGVHLEPSYNQYRKGNLYQQLGFHDLRRDKGDAGSEE